MLQDNHSINNALMDAKFKHGDLFRFCFSDKCVTSLDHVFSGKLPPLEYADIVVNQQYDYIFQTFLKPVLGDLKLSEPWARSWAYDIILRHALYTRIACARPDDMGRVQDLLTASILFLLSISVVGKDLANRSGLCEFGTYAGRYHLITKNSYDMENNVRLTQMTNAVSDITKSDWLFRDPLWNKALFSDRERMNQFRRFLHVSFLMTDFTDDQLLEVLGTDRWSIIGLMNEFISIRADRLATSQDINWFLKDVVKQTTKIVVSPLHHYLFGGKLDDFVEQHHRVFSGGNNMTPIKWIVK
jgi:hypothetical protein